MEETPHLLVEVSDEETIPPPEKKSKIEDELSDKNCEESGDDDDGDEGSGDDDDEDSGDQGKKPRVIRDPFSDDEYWNPQGEKYEKYCQEVAESEGYDIETFVDFAGCICPMEPVPPSSLPYTISFAEQALEVFNEKNGTKFHLLKVDKVNVKMDCSALSYITFRAKDGDAAETKTFQAKVYPVPGLGPDEVLEVRLRP